MKYSYPHRESFYREIVRQHFNGVSEVTLPSGKKVDVVCPAGIIEVKFMLKWPEAIGQALVYSYETKRKPCIVFIFNQAFDRLFLDNILPAISNLGIAVQTIDVFTYKIIARNQF